MRDPATKKIPLIEMFGPTIQGEGFVIGQQTYFLRFGLCDYKCTMCDSMHAVDPQQVKANAEYLTNAEIADRFYHQFHKPNTTRWVTFSGGNPAIHDLDFLVNDLVSKGFSIAVETQGTFCPNWLQHCQVVTCSPKGPGMGEQFEPQKFDAFCFQMHHVPGFNIKVVIFDERDLEFARMIIERTAGRYPIFLSQGNHMTPSDPVQWDHATHIEQLRQSYLRLFEDIQNDPLLSSVKFLPQFHVWLWGNRQGV